MKSVVHVLLVSCGFLASCGTVDSDRASGLADAAAETVPQQVGPPLELGLPLSDLPETLKTLPGPGSSGVSHYHVFTIPDPAGDELIGMNVGASEKFLFVFRHRKLDRIVLYPPSVWQPTGPGRAEIVVPKTEEVIEAAIRSSSLSVEEVHGIAEKRRREEETALKKREPLIFGALLSEREGRQHVAKFKELNERFDATKVHLGDTPEAVAAQFGAATTTEAIDGEFKYEYTSGESAGWLPVPKVVVWFSNGRAVRVFTEYLSRKK